MASASPRRKQLFREIVEGFEILPATGEECVDESLSPDNQCLLLALQKAREIAKNHRGKYVLGADTVVAIDGKAVPKEYRIFKIKTVEGANDFASMY